MGPICARVHCFSNKSTCSAFAPRIKCVQFRASFFDVFSGLIVPTEPWGRWRRRPRASVLADGCAFCAALLPDDGGLFSNVRRLCFALIAADSRAHARVRSCCGLSLNAAEGYVSGPRAGPDLHPRASRRVSSSRARCLQPAPCRDAGGSVIRDFARLPETKRFQRLLPFCVTRTAISEWRG